MSKKNNDFFAEKKAWSVVKDELLGCYFMPYVSKILHTYRPLVYVDCFAGKGKFDDGNPGSPLIALEVIDKCQESTCFKRLSAQTRRPENNTKLPDLDKMTKRLEIMRSIPSRGCEWAH